MIAANPKAANHARTRQGTHGIEKAFTRPIVPASIARTLCDQFNFTTR